MVRTCPFASLHGTLQPFASDIRRIAGSSRHVRPPSSLRKRADGSIPASSRSGSCGCTAREESSENPPIAPTTAQERAPSRDWKTRPPVAAA